MSGIDEWYRRYAETEAAAARARAKQAYYDQACRLCAAMATVVATTEMSRLACLLNPNLSAQDLEKILSLAPNGA